MKCPGHHKCWASCAFSLALTKMETRNAMKHYWDIEELFEHFTLLPQVLVTAVAGQNRLETTRRDSLPSAEDREETQEGLHLDYSWGTFCQVPHRARCRRRELLRERSLRRWHERPHWCKPRP
jgi:hypothetical protein